VPTDATVAVNGALDAPAATIIDTGTVTELLLLAKLTFTPAFGAALFRVAVHAPEPEPVKETVPQETALNAAGTAEMKV
jgi:hypothetical protein